LGRLGSAWWERGWTAGLTGCFQFALPPAFFLRWFGWFGFGLGSACGRVGRRLASGLASGLLEGACGVSGLTSGWRPHRARFGSGLGTDLAFGFKRSPPLSNAPNTPRCSAHFWHWRLVQSRRPDRRGLKPDNGFPPRMFHERVWMARVGPGRSKALRTSAGSEFLRAAPTSFVPGHPARANAVEHLAHPLLQAHGSPDRPGLCAVAKTSDCVRRADGLFKLPASVSRAAGVWRSSIRGLPASSSNRARSSSPLRRLGQQYARCWSNLILF